MTDSSRRDAPEIDVYRHQAEIVHGRVRRNLEGFSDEEALVQPEPAGHSANWILGHLVEVYERMLERLGRDRILREGTLEAYRQGVDIGEERSEMLDLEALLQAWDESSERIDAGLRDLTAEALDVSDRYLASRPAPTTMRKYLDTILFHQAYHSGQLGLLRRLVGKEGAVP